MPLPVGYTEVTLAEYMRVGVLKHTHVVLGWTDTSANGDYQEAVNNALIAYGETDIVNATDLPRLRAHARIEIWRSVADATVGLTDYNADGYASQRSQMHQAAVNQLNAALRDARAAGYVTESILGTQFGTSESVW